MSSTRRSAVRSGLLTPVLATGLATVLSAALAGPAFAVSPAPTSSPSGVSADPLARAVSGTVTPAVTASASPEVVTPEAAAELKRKADEQAAELSADLAEQQAATQAAAAALEAYQVAQRAADEATRSADQQATRLAEAEAATAEVRARLERYIASLYRTGLGSRELTVYTSLMDSRNPQQLFRGLGMVSRVGGNQNDAFVELARAQQAQARASERAAQSAALAKTASAKAQEARIAADEVVAAAAAKAAETAAALSATEQALAIAEQREVLVARATEVARQRSAVPYEAIEGALAPRPLAECTGGELKGFPNGTLPTAALCPLWGTSGQLLRADAAASFDAMSKAYGAQFGEPLCVTDSYRSFPEQVAVRAAKPTLAAVPGTSNHGWGVAVDLCGGIESFGTPQHAWMMANSMAYGWFLPGWAQAGGSKPEPWHWEFAL